MKARVVYDMYMMGEPGGAPGGVHPQMVMGVLAEQQGFKILDAEPMPIGDCWWFWIEYETKPTLPEFIREGEWFEPGGIEPSPKAESDKAPTVGNLSLSKVSATVTFVGISTWPVPTDGDV